MLLPELRPSTDRRAFTRRFVFSGDASTITEGRDAIVRFLARYGLSDDDEIDLLVAVQEALANAVYHGCGDDAAKKIEAIVDVDGFEINIVIRDPGPGFDTFDDSARDGTNVAQHGRGIMLMRSLMDETAYRRGGSEVHMKKLRRG